jgi:hypothetical protein
MGRMAPRALPDGTVSRPSSMVGSCGPALLPVIAESTTAYSHVRMRVPNGTSGGATFGSADTLAV